MATGATDRRIPVNTQWDPDSNRLSFFSDSQPVTVAGFGFREHVRAPVFDVRYYRAVGDGVADDSAKVLAVAAAINAAGQGTMYFPDGTYKIATGFQLNVPSRVLLSPGATINYTGSGVLCKMGPDSLTTLTYHTKPYIFEGGMVTGGASMTAGIFFNKYVTVCRVKDVYFRDFGNGSAAGIHFDEANWDAEVTGCSYHSTDATAKNWIRNNDTATANTRTRVNNCLGTVLGSGRGYGIHFNGANAELAHSKIEGFSPNVSLGILATDARIHSTYFETLDSNGCIRYGVNGATEYTTGLVVSDCYANMHNALGYTGSFLYPAGADSGLQDSKVFNNSISDIGSNAFISLNTAEVSQVGNYAANNMGYTTFLSGTPAGCAWQGTINGLVRQGTVVVGTGQTTAAMTDAGNTAGQVRVVDIGASAGNGGALVLGANSTQVFAAVKGLVSSTAGASKGHLAFATRNATGDSALTERMRITDAGVLNVLGGIDHDGTTVGFYGTAPIAQQTGVAVSAAGIHAALVALGLITA